MAEDDKLKSIRVLVAYRDIIKTADMYIINLLKTKFRDKFKEYIDYSLLDTLTDEALLLHWVNRPVKNQLNHSIMRKTTSYCMTNPNSYISIAML